MGNSDELRDILERLKGEAGEQPAAAAPARQEPPAKAGWFSRQARPERAPAPSPAPRPRGIDLPREGRAETQAQAAWRENKEAMLFGMLASLIMALGGVLAGLEYLVYLGALGFLAFAGIMALSLLGAAMPRRGEGGDPRLSVRVDALSAKVEQLSAKLENISGGAAGAKRI